MKDTVQNQYGDCTDVCTRCLEHYGTSAECDIYKDEDSLIAIRDALTVLSDLWYDAEDGDNVKKKEHDELYIALDEELKKNGFPLGMDTHGTYEDIAYKVQRAIDNEI